MTTKLFKKYRGWGRDEGFLVYSFPFLLFLAGLRSQVIFKRLRLLTFFLAAPAPDLLPKRLRPPVLFLKQLRLQGEKNMRLLTAPALDYWLSLAK